MIPCICNFLSVCLFVRSFLKRSFFSENETIIFENDRKTKQKRSFNDRFQQRLTTLSVGILLEKYRKNAWYSDILIKTGFWKKYMISGAQEAVK